jgi:hypothetical protein
MKVGDKVKLLSDKNFQSQYLGQVFTVTKEEDGFFDLKNDEDATQMYHPCWGAECYEIVNDTGATSPTGSLRYNSNKPQCNEISPKFLLDMGAVLEKSRAKYPRGNWEKGNNYSVPYDSLMRHLLSWQSGERYDSESGLSHLAHAALNLMMLHYYEENYPEFDDRIFKKDKK